MDRYDGFERRRSMCPACHSGRGLPISNTLTEQTETLALRCPTCQHEWERSRPATRLLLQLTCSFGVDASQGFGEILRGTRPVAERPEDRTARRTRERHAG